MSRKLSKSAIQLAQKNGTVKCAKEIVLIPSTFPTPLNEAVAQVNLVRLPVADVRGGTLFQSLASRFPRVEALPYLLVPLQPGTGVEAPAYRFLTEDGGITVQYGPTLLSVNATRYPGFDTYIDIVAWVAKTFRAISPDVVVSGYSLGYYNRIAINSIHDLPTLLRFRFNIDDGIMNSEFVCQFSHVVPEGSLLTQIITTPMLAPEESIKTLGVNNVVRQLRKAAPFDADDWCKWLTQAHSRAKAMFWENLTPETQAAWDNTVNAAS